MPTSWKNSDSSLKSDPLRIVLHSDLHSAGFMLDPEYNFAAYSQNTNDEVMSGLCNILEKFYPSDVEKQSLALQQLSQFRAGSGLFARDMVKTSA